MFFCHTPTTSHPPPKSYSQTPESSWLSPKHTVSMSPLIIPETMKALVTQSNKTAVVQEIPVPTIDDNEILVQTVAVALNPTDWKCASFIVAFC